MNKIDCHKPCKEGARDFSFSWPNFSSCNSFQLNPSIVSVLIYNSSGRIYPISIKKTPKLV